MCKFLNLIRNYQTFSALEKLYVELEQDEAFKSLLYTSYEVKEFDKEYARLKQGWVYTVFSDVNSDSVCLFEISQKNGEYILRTLLPFSLINDNAQVNAEVIERLSFASSAGHVTQEKSTYGKIRNYLVQPLPNVNRAIVRKALKSTLQEFVDTLKPELESIQKEIADEEALYREHEEDDSDND